MEYASRFLYPALGFLFTVLFGFWLSRRGRPYNGLLFNVHKLIALGSVILAGMAVYQFSKVLDLGTLVIVLVALAAISVVALFATGAFMSVGKGEYRAMKLIHNVAPFIFVITTGYTVYLIIS